MNDDLATMLTPQASAAMIEHAVRHAQSMGHSTADTGHLLLGIMTPNLHTHQQSPVTKRLKHAFGIEYGEVREAVATIDHVQTRFSGTPKTTPAVKSVLKRALKFAKRDKKAGLHNKVVITRFHIAEALVAVADSMFLQVLKELGLTCAQFTNAMEGKLVLQTTAR